MERSSAPCNLALSLLKFDLKRVVVGCKGEGEVGEKARLSGWSDWQDRGEPWGGTWFNAEWTKLEAFVGHREVLLGGWSLRPCLGLSKPEGGSEGDRIPCS